ncbi:MAG TPA: 4-alpha-glucanotransferase [Polyangia bacterium]|nr:4-alpha-glucanotransferase [Polyangia bacterium]
MTTPRVPTLSERAAGVLMHATSLPGGDLGPSAHDMVDFLAAAGQSWWQMLPINPPGLGNSPYSAQSAFAGSPALVSADRLVDDGLLTKSERDLPSDDRWRAAFRAFGSGDEDFANFVEGNGDWLDDFALFWALKRRHGGGAWWDWPADIRGRDPAALDRARAELADEVALERFVQWRFFRDWRALRHHAHKLGIALMGDLPIFVAHDSADVWQHRDQFFLDDGGMPTVVSGVPPDYFSEDGQRWGNPIYRWDKMRQTGFTWWIARFRAALSVFDAVRLDHFIGFARYWEVPGDQPTARYGKWRKGPGTALFQAVGAALGHLPFIAEDLGVVTPQVEALRVRFKFPGLKVLQFAFGTDPQARSFLPHNYPRDAVAYTGTHDNDTTYGWFHDPGSGSRSCEQTAIERRNTFHYLGIPQGDDGREIHWTLIRAIMMSVANVAMVPVQDLLGLGSDQRMNLPGTAEGNWGYRLKPGQLTPAIADRLLDMTETYGRRRPSE